MKAISIEARKRESITRQNVAQLRSENKVPCVMYGGKEPVHFEVSALAVKPLVYTPDVQTVELNIDGTNYSAIVKDLQFHPITDKLLHLDFLQIFPDKPVVIDVPVRLKGSAIGVRQGGSLRIKLRMLTVKALPADLPDGIDLKIDDLNIGDSIKVRDLKIKGVEFLDAPQNEITGVKVTRVVVEEVPVVAATTATAEGAAAVPGAPAAPGAPAGAPGTPAAGAAPAAPAKEEKEKGKKK